MILSPQSDAIIQRLLAKEIVKSGTLTIGPLTDPAVRLLNVFLEFHEELSTIKGEERARKLHEHYAAHGAVPVSRSGKPPLNGIFAHDNSSAASKVAIDETSLRFGTWNCTTWRII